MPHLRWLTLDAREILNSLAGFRNRSYRLLFQ
jgi:hypothetical protein